MSERLNAPSQATEEGEFWRGFETAFKLIDFILINYESNELAKISVWEFIEKLREDLRKEKEFFKGDD